MTTQTATAATSPSTAVTAPKTRKVDIEILTEDEASSLCGLPVAELRRRILPSFGAFLATSLPNGVWRVGNDYCVEANHAKRLREVVSGTPAEKAFAHELSIEARASFDREEPMREAIRAADQRCAAERKAREAAAKEWSDKFRAREQRKAGANYVDAKGVVRNAVGDRVV